MKFNAHSNLEGLHSFLSPSQNSWLNYDDDKLVARYRTAKAAEEGTRLHEFAAEAIRLNKRLYDDGSTLSMYVNDAIGYRMTPEQVLFYSENCFGTADTICFRNSQLRISDYKSGASGHMTQLMVYAGLFCLEYNIKPSDISIELRLYKQSEIEVCNPDYKDVVAMMDRIRHCDNVISNYRASLLE